MYVQKNNFDIILTCGPQVGFISVLAAKLLGRESWHWFTGLVWFSRPLPYISLPFFIDFLLLLLATRVFADSNWQQKLFKSNPLLRMARRSIASVPANSSITPVDDSIYKLTARKHYFHQREGQQLVIGYLGRIAPDKGLEIIPTIAKELSKDKTSLFKFIVCGPHDHTIALGTCSEIPVSPLGNPLDLGYCIDIRPYLYSKFKFFEEIDILILPSKREGFGIVVIEAFAAGVPVVCSDIPPLRESCQFCFNGINCSNISDYVQAFRMLSNKPIYEIFHANAISSSLPYISVNYLRTLADVYYC